MQCENHFCIYWDNNLCILDKISLDVLGCCQNCIYVDIDDNILQTARKKLLSKEMTDEIS